MTIRILSLLLLLVAPLQLLADMYIDRSIVIFEPGGQPREDVKVSNTSDDVLYIEVKVSTVINPGKENETRETVSDPSELKLIATPSKLVIPPGGQKLIRLVNLKTTNAEERVYRIDVTPIVPPLEEDSSQLRIVVAYQILTIVQPTTPHTHLEATRTANKIVFTNSGNSNILLSEGRQCSAADQNNCKDLASRRLYAGNQWELELPFDAPLSYSVRSHDGIKKENFK